MRILGLSGSLRRDSHNARLLGAASGLLPAGVELEPWSGLAEVPPFDEDAEHAPPPSVVSLKQAIAEADGLLIATPEYNRSIPGQLKNALDWVSRPRADTPLFGKPAAIIGASTGLFGAVWAQAEVRKVLAAIGADVTEDELAVGQADGAFTHDGRLGDAEAELALRELLGALVGARAGDRAMSTLARTPTGAVACALVERPLPVLDADPALLERSDAARNRERALCAARRLFEERGVECVSMDDVARAAGVGKGTLYRRFGDRAGLARALLSEQTRALQDAVIRGAPPLGPGAPAGERLKAFGRALLDLHDQHGALIAAAEFGASGARFRSPPVAFQHLHVSLLVAEAAPGLDAPYVTEALLAPLAADVVLNLRSARELELERIKDGWCGLVDAVLAAGD